MNSAYGKTCQKETIDEVKVLTNKRFEKYLDMNYNSIIKYSVLGENNKIVKTRSSVSEHFNRAHCGSMVLSYSKRLMNRVICLAEDMKLELYYQDTDSMHIQNDAGQIARLEKAFKKKYNSDLIGKQMGQFHSDFAGKSDEDIYAVKSIFLGKKSYIDKVRYINNGVETFDYHIRMKGLNRYAIEAQGDAMEVYEKLFNNEAIDFDFLQSGVVKFEKTFSENISTQQEFYRALCFGPNPVTKAEKVQQVKEARMLLKEN